MHRLASILKNALALAAGSFVVHAIVVACSSGPLPESTPRRTMPSATSPDASAEAGSGPSGPGQTSSAAGCTKWQISAFVASQTFLGDADGLGPAIDVPMGWEPLGALPFVGRNNASKVAITVRQCVQ